MFIGVGSLGWVSFVEGYDFWCFSIWERYLMWNDCRVGICCDIIFVCGLDDVKFIFIFVVVILFCGIWMIFFCLYLFGWFFLFVEIVIFVYMDKDKIGIWKLLGMNGI